MSPTLYSVGIMASGSVCSCSHKVGEDTAHTKPPNINRSSWIRGGKGARQRYKSGSEEGDRCEKAEYIFDTNQ